MQSIINLKWFSKVVIVFLIFSLLTPPVTYAADAGDRGDGGGESDAESAAEKEAAKEAAEAEQAAKDAADVNTAASISGAAAAGISASAVSTAGPATPGNVNVSVNGAPAVSMSKAAAMAAVGAVAGATKSGTVSAKSVGVSTEKTVSGYAKGTLSSGQVEGATTGYRGSPADVQAKEAANSTSRSVSSLANAPTSVAPLSDAAFDARFNATTQPSLPTIDPTTAATVPSLTDALAQAATALNREFGVAPAQAEEVGMEVDVAPKAYVTNDLAKYNTYKEQVAPIDAKLATAWNDLGSVVDNNPNEDNPAEAAAYAEIDSLTAQKQGVISSNFNTNAREVQFSGTPQGTKGVAANTGSPDAQSNEAQPGGTVGDSKTPAGSPTGSATAVNSRTPDFSYNGKATDVKSSTNNPTGGTGTAGTGKTAQVAAQVATRDNTIEREGGSGVTADRNITSRPNSLNLPGQPEIETDINNVVNIPVVNVNDLSNAQAQVVGIVNNDLSPAAVEAGAIALAGELYGPATTRISQGKATEQDIVAAKTQIFAYANRAAANGKSFEENVKQASVVFYTPDSSPKGYAVNNYNQNPTAFKQMVKDIMKGTYGIDVPCPNCVDFGAAGPDIFDQHVNIPSGTYTNAGRPQHTSPETAAAIESAEISKANSLLTFQERGLTPQTVDVASMINPPTLGGSGSDNVTDETPTAALPDGDDSDTGTNANSKAGQVIESQRGSTRSAGINGTIKDQLAYAGEVTGTYFVVGSGGNQMSKAEYKAAKGKKTKIGNVNYLNGKAVRVGSTRHDSGNSADGSIVDAATGRTLDFSNAADRARIGDFITAAVKAGATGVGAAADYMGVKTVHIGGGGSLSWGKGGKAKNVPDWVKAAHTTGLEQAENFDLAEYNAAQGNTNELAEAGVDQENTAALPVSEAAATALDKVEAAKDKIAEGAGVQGNPPGEDKGTGTPEADPTPDDDTASNEATAAAASAGIEALEERITEIEAEINTKDLTDEQISDLSAEIDAATEAIDSFNKAVEEAEADNTEAGKDNLAQAQEKLAEVTEMTETNKTKTANAPDRATPTPSSDTAEGVTDEVPEEVEPAFENPIPEPVMAVIKNPVARAVITAAIFGTNPVVGIAVAVGLEQLKNIPIVDKILNDILKFDSDATLSPRTYEGGNNNQATSTRAIYTVPVIVTTDMETGNIDLTVSEMIYDYESIEDSEEGEEFYYPGNGGDGNPPLILNEFGEIVYSDGTYAPIYVNGVEYPDPEVEYVYISQTINSAGPVAIADNSSMLPENFATNFIRGIFGNNGQFTIDDVYGSVRYRVDPDEAVPNDEYYDYVFTLKDRTLRTVAIPVYTSFATMQDRLTSVGYEGNILLLLNQVTDGTREAKPNLATRALDVIKNTIQSLWPEEEMPRVTDLTDENYSTDNIFNIRDIKEATVYVGIEASCPNVEGLNQAYIYEVVVYQSSIPGATADGIIQEVRCGTGDPLTYATEITRHLERVNGFAHLDANEFLGLLTFNFYNPLSASSPTDLDDIVIPDQEIPVDDVEPLPNTTNLIRFEVRATDRLTGAVIKDWSNSDLAIDSGVKLDFRWDGSEYTQCLPFLNDNGDYALSQSDTDAMTIGDTAAKNYDVIEGAYAYRIECGGQKNNEFGVDAKIIKITLE